MDENADNRISLGGAEKRKLRGQAQLLDAKISIGKKGITPEMLDVIKAHLKNSPLVKVRFSEGRAEMKAQIAEIEREAGIVCVGNVGRTASFFRPLPANPEK